MKRYLAVLSVVLLSFTSCISSVEEDEKYVVSQEGFYFLNEGQWGQDNATLGYYSTKTDTYSDSWWSALNTSVRPHLGDVGNSLLVTSRFVCAAVNGSNLIEVCTRDGAHLATLEIPSPRCMATDGSFAYISSYAGDGQVFKVDLTTLGVVGQVNVGYEPEGLCVVGTKLFVGNSGGYHGYESSISVIDIASFREEERIQIQDACNFYGGFTLMPDGTSILVNASGNYYDIPANSFVFDTKTRRVSRYYDFPATYSCTVNGKTYVLASAFSYDTYSYVYSSCIIGNDLEPSDFPIPNDEFYAMSSVAGLWVSPVTGDIYIADAGNYTSPGYLMRYDKEGSFIKKYTVGVCPGHLEWDIRLVKQDQ